MNVIVFLIFLLVSAVCEQSPLLNARAIYSKMCQFSSSYSVCSTILNFYRLQNDHSFYYIECEQMTFKQQ